MDIDMSAAAVAGTLGGMLSIGSLLPQAYRIIQRRSAADVSLSTYLIIVAASGLWTFYGYVHAAMEVLIANVVIAVIAGVIAVLKILYGADARPKGER